MVRVPTRETSTKPLELKVLGADGVNLSDDPSVLPARGLSISRNLVLFDGIQRRAGYRKVSKMEDVGEDYGAKVFGSDAKYGYFTPPLIGLGGFALPFSFTAVRPVSSYRHIWSSWVSHAAVGDTGVIWATLSSVGNFTILVNWEGGSIIASTITADAVPANSECHALIVYDDEAGTLTLYLNGEVAGTPLVVGSGLQPRQDPGVVWYVGVSYDPGVGVETGFAFQGALDDLALISLAGVDLTDADATLEPPRRSMLDELRRGNFQEVVCPSAGSLLFCYKMDEPITEYAWTPDLGVMYDSSERAQHGVYVGGPTNATRIARRAQNGQFLGTVRRAAVGELRDGRVNLAVVGGTVFSERLQRGV